MRSPACLPRSIWAWVIFVLLGCGPRSLWATPITALAFSPDGRDLVSNGDRRLDVRSPKDGEIQRRFECPLRKITSMAFTPDGRFLAVGGGDPGVRGAAFLFAWPEGKVVDRITNHSDLVTHVAFDPTGKKLGIASSDHGATVWTLSSTATLIPSITLRGHAAPVLALEFSPSGMSLVTASPDRSIYVWSVDGQRVLRSFSQHTEAVHALAFRPRTTAAGPTPVVCATAGDDRTVRIWQPEIGRMVRIVRHHDGPIFALAWSPDGATLFSAGKEGVIRCIDGDSDTLRTRWHAHDDWIYSLAVSPDGAALASGDWSGRVVVHDLRPGLPPADHPTRAAGN